MSEYTGTEGQVDIQALAAQMLGVNEEYEDDEYDDYEDDDESNEAPGGHPAWAEILNSIPAEYHSQVIPTLQGWDAGVSRQFQKIHDSYAPYRQYQDIDPEQIRDALGVYEALNENPEATWEAIGRVYGLSPQQVSQAMSSDDDDDDEDYLGDLPKGVRNRLSQLDMHEQVLEAVTDELLQRQASEREAQEDEELEDYLEALREEYGDFDEDYVVGLIASGIDGEEAVGAYQEMVETLANQYGGGQRWSAPNVMSSGGGIPNAEVVNPYRLSNQNTQDLVAEILRMTNED